MSKPEMAIRKRETPSFSYIGIYAGGPKPSLLLLIVLTGGARQLEGAGPPAYPC